MQQSEAAGSDISSCRIATAAVPPQLTLITATVSGNTASVASLTGDSVEWSAAVEASSVAHHNTNCQVAAGKFPAQCTTTTVQCSVCYANALPGGGSRQVSRSSLVSSYSRIAILHTQIIVTSYPIHQKSGTNNAKIVNLKTNHPAKHLRQVQRTVGG